MAGGLNIQELLQRNELYAKSSHVPFPDLKDVAGKPNFLSVVIVSCVDARVQPEKFLQLKPGEAFVLKTVAGHPTNVVNDILVLDALSPLKKLIIMHHTDCGASHVSDEMIKEKLASRLPHQKDEIAAMSFGTITDIEDSLKKDVNFIRSHSYMRPDLAASTTGMVYDLKTGLIREVDVPIEKSHRKSEL